jgi:hypothetical protein
MRRSISFFALCSALDEGKTFFHILTGGFELNPRVAYLLGVHPLLYPLLDSILIFASVLVDRTLRIDDIWLVWAAAGVARLVCLGWGWV